MDHSGWGSLAAVRAGGRLAVRGRVVLRPAPARRIRLVAALRGNDQTWVIGRRILRRVASGRRRLQRSKRPLGDPGPIATPTPSATAAPPDMGTPTPTAGATATATAGATPAAFTAGAETLGDRPFPNLGKGGP